MNLKIKNALISVSNKENLTTLLKTLKRFNINIISSGGTYASIKKLGFKCTELSKYTGFKEMLDGRVKTLHPKIHAGILHDRQNKKHKNEMSKKNFPAIDLIVVNFYPFQKIVLSSKNPKQIIENKLECPCEFFCPPFGIPEKDFFVKRDLSLAKKIGYRSVLVGARGAMTQGELPHMIFRDHFLANWSTAQLRYFLSL